MSEEKKKAGTITLTERTKLRIDSKNFLLIALECGCRFRLSFAVMSPVLVKDHLAILAPESDIDRLTDCTKCKNYSLDE